MLLANVGDLLLALISANWRTILPASAGIVGRGYRRRLRARTSNAVRTSMLEVGSATIPAAAWTPGATGAPAATLSV